MIAVAAHENGAIVDEANMARADALMQRRCDTEDDAACARELAQRYDGLALELHRTFKIQPFLQSASVVHGGTAPSLSALHSPTEIVDAVSGSDKSISCRAARWIAAHRLVCHDECPPLGAVPTRRRVCFEAQRCVCTGDGRRLAALEGRLRLAFYHYVCAMGMKSWSSMLYGGELVLRLRVATTEEE